MRKTYLALIVVSDVGDHHGRLSWVLRGDALEGHLVLAHHDQVGTLIEVPEADGLTDAGAGSSDNYSLVQKVIFKWLGIKLLVLELILVLPHLV